MGWGRASRWELDRVESIEWNPLLLAQRDELLSAGEIVKLDIAFYPSSTYFAAAGGLEIVVNRR